MKLTDTELVLLSAASQRQDGAVKIGAKLKGAAANKVIGKLLSQHLVDEIPAQGGPPVWWQDNERGALALRITAQGLAAIGGDSHREVSTEESGSPQHEAMALSSSGVLPRWASEATLTIRAGAAAMRRSFKRLLRTK